MFQPMNTAGQEANFRKVLLYAHHGWGKTTQMANYQKHYGKGFIISMESGLSSIRSAGIDYLPVTSWDGTHEPDKGIYSFKGVCGMIASPEFHKLGYKWIGIDSLTELADLCYAQLESESKARGDKNGFAVWGEYATALLGACKWIRDMSMHVIVTCLAKDETNDNGLVEYWPMVPGQRVQKQLPGIFDCVLCGVKHTREEHNEKGQTRTAIDRYIVTEEVKGWRGKVRDEHRRLKPIELCGDVTELFQLMDMSQEQFEARK